MATLRRPRFSPLLTDIGIVVFILGAGIATFLLSEKGYEPPERPVTQMAALEWRFATR